MSASGDQASRGGGLEALLGVGYDDDGPGATARGRLPVSEAVLQPYGTVHGGAYSALAETVASRATDRAVRDQGMAAIGQAISVTFVRPIAAGHLNATAVPRHRGRTTWVWDVEIADDEGRLCALARMTVAVRPRPDG